MSAEKGGSQKGPQQGAQVGSSTDRSRPLDGIKVLDFTSMVSGPYCTRLLADMGATVIKVESPAGDLIRFGTPHSKSGSRYFQAFNAGKQSIVLDLKSPRALQHW